jgi:hypothetical protein
MVRKTVISQLQSVGEGALGKLAQSPATRGAVQGAVHVKERGERLLRTLDSIEERLATIEKRLSTLEKATPKRSATGQRSTSRASRPPADKTKTGA